jgi:hypothetical protein
MAHGPQSLGRTEGKQGESVDTGTPLQMVADKALSEFWDPARNTLEIFLIGGAESPLQSWLFVQDNEKVNSDKRQHGII